jgi:hypothetical protein
VRFRIASPAAQDRMEGRIARFFIERRPGDRVIHFLGDPTPRVNVVDYSGFT